MKGKKSGSGREPKSEYTYFDILLFLKPVVTNKETTTNISDSEAHEEVEEEQGATSTELRSTPSRKERKKKRMETDGQWTVCAKSFLKVSGEKQLWSKEFRKS
ncbi:hypothetical protein B7P43_G08737 [Cryptotermes secundus]|uniref:Uncharacterized protein n=1 Tax=Cryptotermes secundus TaxID=105785 RepID=A0A2J7RNR9_9NEOP|nr:hypothetical protein B7P43_G08737 [Cryptotermes secundus]